MPAIGFGTGLERVVLALKSQGVEEPSPGVEVFFVVLHEEARPVAVAAAHELRLAGISADIDYAGRKAKGQMKQASRAGAAFAVIIGEDELRANQAAVKDMSTGEQEQVEISSLVSFLKTKLRQ